MRNIFEQNLISIQKRKKIIHEIFHRPYIKLNNFITFIIERNS